MPYCTISNCRNRSIIVNVKKGGISYHQFPKDPNIKEKWINATGLKDWFPTKHSTICSSHFAVEDYDTSKKIRRLLPDAYPKIDVWVTDEPQEVSMTPNSCETSSESTNRNSLAKTRGQKILMKQLAHAKDILKQQRIQIKRLRERNRRAKKKILDLEEMITDLENNSLIIIKEEVD